MNASPNVAGDAIPQLSVFCFSDVARDSFAEKYEQLLSTARLADELNFHAIWTPERHFHTFGGMFPNPSIISAALAACTRRIGIRAGSVVLPLHDPLRVAEEWALVDNLSRGRVGIAFSAGWQRNDFVLNAQNYRQRHEVLFTSLEQVQSLWRGESVTRHDLSLPGHPEPVTLQTWPPAYQDTIGVWITTGSNPLLFSEAGKRGLNVLTHLIAQTREQLQENCASYRLARQVAGLDPAAGKITLMMHTQAGEDRQALLPRLRPALTGYLQAFMQLSENLHEPSTLAREASDKKRAYTLKLGVEKYLSHYGLFGSAAECLEQLRQLKREGIDEVAGLVDFGMSQDSVETTLRTLATLL
ncbi:MULTISPECIES: MupA/Atu3671 family FMN-dependent luciferase-like monooxygenase [unclassified Pseudomonas]|uniref:MupA/Atu3671 family FMN-dependent luciferase-like monooxygenase n=1 Tax=unclassified Pseudomonas TaxID=196821 RepID=UPI0011990467|nr:MULTISPECIES: MupA/Atu3671 family FMN-dependent luciferase-like monooxygenase [unclassified Pseudomonas]TWC22886.1 natural product biosynthesis luciferase-like monooxygenase protein [Pseudomonas sp. SJZ075]TWC24850.1 natural product biosynthesis luciferase-like monooxygenase protein [Pseudomonas sp. SJZ074]TWC38234.1 natural product biosynthesis luciferase-like monooxygenase protein [Pseudomonas sp. SJZ078]TWC40933.1 natural product biosynthesis luciferase-like monooxygenase protein [Pseudom